MSLRERTRAFVRALILLSLLLAPGLARADEPTITIAAGDNKRSFTRDELLARADATTIEVARDITYRLPMSYRAAASRQRDRGGRARRFRRAASARPHAQYR